MAVENQFTLPGTSLYFESAMAVPVSPVCDACLDNNTVASFARVTCNLNDTEPLKKFACSKSVAGIGQILIRIFPALWTYFSYLYVVFIASIFRPVTPSCRSMPTASTQEPSMSLG